MVKTTLDYKKMVDEIDDLVETDFCFDMELKQLPKSKPITKKEALEMVKILGQIYMISHCNTCKACQGRYVITTIEPDEYSPMLKLFEKKITIFGWEIILRKAPINYTQIFDFTSDIKKILK